MILSKKMATQSRGVNGGDFYKLKHDDGTFQNSIFFVHPQRPNGFYLTEILDDRGDQPNITPVDISQEYFEQLEPIISLEAATNISQTHSDFISNRLEQN